MTEPSLGKRMWTLFVLCSCVAMVFISFTSFFPTAVLIARDTGATSTEITWMVDAYTLTMAAFLLPAGAIGDRYGRRGVMNLGMTAFLASSALALFADTPHQLIVVRAFQGVAAALVMPSTLSLITTVFPADKRAAAVTIWSAVMACSGVVGVMGSAALVEFYEWESILWGTLVVAVVTFGLGWTIPTSKEQVPPRFDAWGALLGMVICGAAVFGLIEGGAKGWASPVVGLSLGIAAVAAAVFVAVEMRVPDPMLDVRVFRNRAFAAGAVAVGVSFSMMYGDFYLGLLYFQYVEDLSAFEAALFTGFAMACGLIPVTLLSILIGSRLSLRTYLVLGLGLISAAMLVLSIDGAYSNVLAFAAVVAVLSAGVGLVAGPASNAIVDNVPENKQGVASAVNHATRDVGIAFAIALFGSLQTSRYREDIGPATEALPEPARDASRESIAAALAVADQSGGAGAGLADAALAEAGRDAFTAGMQYANLLVGIGLAVIIVGIAVLTPGRTAVAVAVRASGVSGVVRTLAGDPVAGAGLALTDLAGRQVGRTFSDDRGNFHLAVAEPGEHVLICAAAGLRPTAQRVSWNGSAAHHDLTLAAPETGPNAPAQLLSCDAADHYIVN